jgi:hypothetical protein
LGGNFLTTKRDGVSVSERNLSEEEGNYHSSEILDVGGSNLAKGKLICCGSIGRFFGSWNEAIQASLMDSEVCSQQWEALLGPKNLSPHPLQVFM